MPKISENLSDIISWYEKGGKQSWNPYIFPDDAILNTSE